MAIDSFDELVSLLPGQAGLFSKLNVSSVASGYVTSLWGISGRPAAGSNPPTGSGEIASSSTLGAMPFVNAVTGKDLYLVKEFAVSSVAGTLILYDRLVHTSGLVGNVTTLQTVNSVAVDRPDSSGLGCEIWVECYSAISSASSMAFTANYTNSDGTQNRTTVSTTVGNSSFPARMAIPIPLQVGDVGVRSVQGLTISVAGGSAGNLGITIARPILAVPIPTGGVGSLLDVLSTGKPKIFANSCLALAFISSGSATGQILGSYNLVSA